MKIFNFTTIALISIFFTGCTSSTLTDEKSYKDAQSKRDYCQEHYFSAAASLDDRKRSAVRCDTYARQVYEERGANGFSERSAEEIIVEKRRGRAN